MTGIGTTTVIGGRKFVSMMWIRMSLGLIPPRVGSRGFTVRFSSLLPPPFIRAIADDCFHWFLDFVAQHKLPQPELKHEVTKEGYRLWAVMGNEHLELRTRPANIEEGQQKLAKKIMVHLLKKMEDGWGG
jgi:hypothetical protein